MLGFSKAARAKMPLQDFCEWLNGQGRESMTVAVYAAHVRSVFHVPEEARRALEDPQAARDLILEYDRSLPPATSRVFRCAMRAFSHYVFEKTGGKVELLPPRAFSAPVLKENHPLTPLLAAISSDVPFHRLVDLKWKHVKPIQGRGVEIRIYDPATGRDYSVPTETLRAINLWAGGGELVKNRDTPLVPREPLSPFPMPASILRKLACQ